MDSSQSSLKDLKMDALPPSTKKALQELSTQQWLRRSKWYLAGGTALTLHAGHRRSVDLDFFTPLRDFSTGKLLAHFSPKQWVTDIVREGTIFGRFLGAKVSFIAYPFFVSRHAPHWFGAVRILDPKDIAVMKIIAISQRGRKRDFVDLYWYVHHQEPLLDVLLRVDDQYPGVAHDYHHIIKSLMYFTDAESDPMPTLYFTVTWKTVKAYFEHEVPKIAKQLFRLQ